MISKKDFEQILQRYFNGTATDREIEWIEKWYQSLDSKNNYPAINESDEQSLHQQDWKKIQKRIKNQKKILFWPSLAAAAASVIMGLIFIYNLDPGQEISDKGKKSISLAEEKIVNESDDVKMVMLPDSSTVLLQPHSTIRISAAFNNGDRKISLSGEAFFNVVRDKNRPFKVYTHDVVTTVLGTSFTIKAPSVKEKIIVVVKTGRVAVSSNVSTTANRKAAAQEVIVTPNQQAVFNPESKVLKATLVQNPVILSKTEQTKQTKSREIFDETPIIDILDKVEEIYGVEIQYDRAVLINCRITTAFLNEGLFERLDILSKAIGGSYAVEETQIIFKSNGCTTSQ